MLFLIPNKDNGTAVHVKSLYLFRQICSHRWKGCSVYKLYTIYYNYILDLSVHVKCSAPWWSRAVSELITKSENSHVSVLKGTGKNRTELLKEMYGRQNFLIFFPTINNDLVPLAITTAVFSITNNGRTSKKKAAEIFSW